MVESQRKCAKLLAQGKHKDLFVNRYNSHLYRKLVDSEEFSPEAISELGLWRSTDSHRHYYRISTTIRHKSANVITAAFD